MSTASPQVSLIDPCPRLRVAPSDEVPVRARYLLKPSSAFLFVFGCITLGWAHLGLAQPLASQEPAGSPAGYEAAISLAVEEFDHNNFAEAREEFRRAHALLPSARTLRALGLTEFELRNYGDSVKYLEAALHSTVRPLAGKLKAEAKSVLARARSYVGEVHLDIEPRASVVLVDGIAIEVDFAESLVLNVGDHVLEFRSEGRVAERRAVTIEGGRSERLQVVLQPAVTVPHSAAEVPSPAARESAPRAPRSDSVPLYKRWWLWTAVGVAVSGAVVATALALSPESTTERVPVTTGNTPSGVSLQPLWSY